jgi:predicted negative regulator of RcsB-dependent stress response
MTQATTHPHAKKMQRKDLKQPDEFISLTGRVVDWARANAVAVQIGAAVLVAILLIVVGVRWWITSRAEAAARQFYGASELFKRAQWSEAEKDFAEVANGYGSTPYGNLAKLYAGRAALNDKRPAEAIPMLNDFVDGAPSPALEQLGRVALGTAFIETGDAKGAREQLERAQSLAGPLAPEITIGLARIAETDGNKDKAIELYQKYLTDEPSGAAASQARMRLVALGATPPASPAGPTFPIGVAPGMAPIEIP